MTVKWQDIAKYGSGGSIALLLVLVGILNMSGMSYTIPSDQVCTDCYDIVHVNSTIWEIKVEHAGSKDIVFAKQMSSRTRWVNLDRIDEFIPTNPKVKTEILVPTTKKYATINHPTFGYLRPLKDGDTLIARQNANNPDGDWFVIHGETGGETVKWGLELENWLMKDISFDPVWFGSGDDSGLVGKWSFEGDFKDSSGQGNDGTQSGGVKITSGVKGRACGFDGVNDYVESSSISTSNGNHSFSLWFNANQVTARQHLLYDAFSIGFVVSNSKLSLREAATSGKSWSFADTAGSTTLNVNQWYHVVVVSNGSGIYGYLNGVLDFNDTSYNGSLVGLNDVIIGSRPGTDYFNGSIDEVRIYNRSLSATEISALYDSGKTYHLSIKTTPTQGLIDETGLVGYFKFNNNYLDSSGLGTTLTKIGTSITYPKGKFDLGASFDGSCLYAPDALLNTTQDYTYSLWAYMLNGMADKGLIGDASGGDCTYNSGSMIYLTNNNLCVYVYNNTVTSICTSATPLIGEWHNLVVLQNSTNTSFYIDGSLVGSTNKIYCDGSYLSIGTYNRRAQSSFNGTLDEIRIYNRSLSATEVANLYNGTKSNYISIKTTPELGLLNDTPLPEISDNTGLVGWWKLDDYVNGNTTDSSGQGNNGSVIGATYTSSARWDGGYSFDGVNDYVLLPDNIGNINLNGSSSFSLSAWVKDGARTTTDNTLLSLFATHSITLDTKEYNDPTFRSAFKVRNSTDNSEVALFGNPLPNKWVFLTAVYDISSGMSIYEDGTLVNSNSWVGAIKPATENNLIGSRLINAGFINGTIDEVRIYNRSLSAEEIKELYLSKGLVGHWKMDAGTGSNSTKAIDSSGYGNTGTVTGATFTNQGRFKEGYSFDGVDDRIGISYLNKSEITYSLWVKPNVLGAFRNIITTMSTLVRIDNTNLLWYPDTYIQVVTASNVIPSANKWYHIVITQNSSNYYSMYVNGINITSGSTVALNTKVASDLIGGYGSVFNFNGSIDEVRIYNRALTAQEISGLYNGTKSNYLSLRSTIG